MENPHREWRIDFARQISDRLPQLDGLKAAIVAGSVARGYADEYSDLELPLFWEPLPGDALRRQIAAALDAEFLTEYDGPSREDQLLINGVQVDLWHVGVAHEEDLIGSVLGAERTDLSALNALDTIRTCIPLRGQELIQTWKIRVQEYPDLLASRVIQDQLAAFRVAELFLHAQRNDPTGFYSRLTLLQQEVFLVLLALNRRYFPTFKWLFPVLEEIQIKPAAISRRFRAAFSTPFEEAAADMRSILEETLQLVESQFPQIDLGAIRRRLYYVRAAHHEADISDAWQGIDDDSTP